MANLITTPPANVDTTTRVDFNKPSFEKLIYQKGLDVVWEQAIHCPCKDDEAANQGLSSCKNCGGTGWVFINPEETKMIIHSMNLNTRYKEWSMEKLGTVSISARDINRIGYMDRITLPETIVPHSQVLHPKLINDGGTNKLYSFLTYPITDAVYVAAFLNDSTPLKRLLEGDDFSIEGNKILLTYSFNPTLANSDTDLREVDTTSIATPELISFKDSDNDNKLSVYILINSTDIENFPEIIRPNDYAVGSNEKVWKQSSLSITVKYEHSMQYHVIDLPRENMVTDIKEEGATAAIQMPIHAIGRRAHYILNCENFNGDRILDNSFDPNC